MAPPTRAPRAAQRREAALLASQPAASRMREAEAMQARAACEIAVLQREVGVSERQV